MSLQKIHTFLYTLSACTSLFLAHQYTFVGFGIKPILSVPLALLLFVCAFHTYEQD